MNRPVVQAARNESQFSRAVIGVTRADIATERFALGLDGLDPLRSYRDRFTFDDAKAIYLDGNSLGRPLKESLAVLDKFKDDWRNRLISGWMEAQWLAAPSRIGDKIANLIGAEPGEVIVTDTTSANIFKLLVAAVRLKTDHHKIVTDELNFPSDIYMAQSVASMFPNHKVIIAKSKDGLRFTPKDLQVEIDSDTAAVIFSHVNFKSGGINNLAALARTAHEGGALAFADFCHSTGVVPIDVKSADLDGAVGCTYKFLNGGPGSPAFVYVPTRLHASLLNVITAWLGRKNPFAFELASQPAPDMRSFLSGTPQIASLLPVEPGVDLTLEVGVKAIREKSTLQTDYLIKLFDLHLASLGFTLKSPRESFLRGSHVALGHPNAYQITQALIKDKNIVPDFREPDNLRIGIAPLYTSFHDIWSLVTALRSIVQSKSYEKYSAERGAVT